ncbi:MAG: OsmC family protein [Xanthomonadales bacterium]|nr:OsmC family protein [Xanthomonadales bacterium]
MQEFPHHYVVEATAGAQGDVLVSSENLPVLVTSAPPEFGGPDDRWSPETLLVAAVADCFILTFRAIARSSKLDWNTLKCEATGKLERVDGVTRFTAFRLRVNLSLPEGVPAERAERLMHKAEEVCLITRSLNASTTLDTHIESDLAEAV